MTDKLYKVYKDGSPIGRPYNKIGPAKAVINLKTRQKQSGTYVIMQYEPTIGHVEFNGLWLNTEGGVSSGKVSKSRSIK